jgi:hypothetical protein
VKQIQQPLWHFTASLVLLALFGASNAEEASSDTSAPAIEDLGNQQYRVGNIVVDKRAGEFTVEGIILNLTQPLEYVAVKTDGYKGYESLLELSTTAVDFQLACILIGLDDTEASKPRFQFDNAPVTGEAVTVSISWDEEGEQRVVSAQEAIGSDTGKLADGEWIYIGSRMSPQDGSLMAEMSGTLIGFVHDPMSVIEHSTGTGTGTYGLVTGNEDLLPAEGSEITVTVKRVEQLAE